MKAVNAGEVEGAVIYHYYYFGDQAKTGENSKNVALHYFQNQDPGAFVSISGGGVLASSKHKEQAQAVPRSGSRARAARRSCATATPSNMRSAIGEASNAALPALSDLQYPKVDPATLNSAKGHRPDDGGRSALIGRA